MTPVAQAQRILIVRPSALGDVCRTVPVLASLRRAFPAAHIGWLVQDDFAAAIEAHPALNELIQFPRARFAQWWRHPRHFLEMVSWFTALRRRRYDLVLDCQGLGRSGLMTFATGARQRVGWRTARELAWLGYNLRAPQHAHQSLPTHTVDQMLALLEAIQVQPLHDMRLYVNKQHREWWDRQRDSRGLTAEKYAVLAPTARWPSKRWPIDRYQQLIIPLAERGFQKIVIIGAPGERDQVGDLLQRESLCIDMVGQSNIGQTMAVIAQAGLVVANDSAPLHMAVGFQRPCVGLFGPTDPAVVGPYGKPESVIRGFADDGTPISFKDSRLGDRLMRCISTAAVIQRIDRVLALAQAGVRQSRTRPQAVAVESMNADVQGGMIEGAAS